MYVLHLFLAKELKRCLLHSPIASHSLTTLHCTLKLWLWATAGQHKTPRDSARSAGEQMQADKLLLDHIWSPPGCVASFMGCWKRSAMESGMFAWQYVIPRSINYTYLTSFMYTGFSTNGSLWASCWQGQNVRLKKMNIFPPSQGICAQASMCLYCHAYLQRLCMCRCAFMCSWKERSCDFAAAWLSLRLWCWI